VPTPELLEWIESTGLSVEIREGAFAYPLIGALHLLSIALFGGMVAATDLRLLGCALQVHPVSTLIRDLRPWKWLGFVAITVSGLLLMWGEPVRLYHSPSFWTKMTLLALVGVHAAVFRPRVYAHPEKLDAQVTREAKIAAAVSLILWVGLILSGRLIAFDPSFD
jgi:hypothetical protein